MTSETIAPGFGRAAKRGLEAKIPMRLHPVRALLTASDEQSRIVLDDWIKEQSWNVAHDLFMVSRPTKFQVQITQLVIGRGTTVEQCFERAKTVEGKSPKCVYETFAEAKRQLTIHAHALWVRVIQPHMATTAQGEECLLTFEGLPTGTRDGKAQHYVQFRARCTVLGCVMSSYPTQHALVEHPLLDRMSHPISPLRSGE